MAGIQGALVRLCNGRLACRQFLCWHSYAGAKLIHLMAPNGILGIGKNTSAVA
jgi:hypothetical protein